MSEIDYRYEGLKGFVNDELAPWVREQGFLPSDLEDIADILKEKYSGEREKFDKLMGDMTQTRIEAQAFLDKIKAERDGKSHKN